MVSGWPQPMPMHRRTTMTPTERRTGRTICGALHCHWVYCHRYRSSQPGRCPTVIIRCRQSLSGRQHIGNSSTPVHRRVRACSRTLANSKLSDGCSKAANWLYAFCIFARFFTVSGLSATWRAVSLIHSSSTRTASRRSRGGRLRINAPYGQAHPRRSAFLRCDAFRVE